jgi:hypothetical protein
MPKKKKMVRFANDVKYRCRSCLEEFYDGPNDYFTIECDCGAYGDMFEILESRIPIETEDEDEVDDHTDSQHNPIDSLKERFGLTIVYVGGIAIFVVASFILGMIMETIYQNGLIIVAAFIISTLTLVISSIFNKNMNSILLKIHRFIISPIFILFLYSGILYWTTWADHINGFGEYLLFFIYLFLGPILSWIIGYMLANTTIGISKRIAKI